MTATPSIVRHALAAAATATAIGLGAPGLAHAKSIDCGRIRYDHGRETVSVTSVSQSKCVNARRVFRKLFNGRYGTEDQATSDDGTKVVVLALGVGTDDVEAWSCPVYRRGRTLRGPVTCTIGTHRRTIRASRRVPKRLWVGALEVDPGSGEISFGSGGA